jgi:hypothetical protein
MTHAHTTGVPYRSRPSEGPAPTPINPAAPHSRLINAEASPGRPDASSRPTKEEKGLTPTERAALNRSMQRHRKAPDLLARH